VSVIAVIIVIPEFPHPKGVETQDPPIGILQHGTLDFATGTSLLKIGGKNVNN